MSQILHIRIKKKYATSILDELIKEDAIETVEEEIIELTPEQKKAIDVELELISADSDYLKNWNEVRHQFKRPR
jgi:hypothetical protein